MKQIQEEHIDLKGTEEGHRGLGTGRVIPPLLAEAGVDVLVSREFGEGMAFNLEREGIIPYLSNR
jgi:predicted Fe-Mo cluster-binding NifX family protein